MTDFEAAGIKVRAGPVVVVTFTEHAGPDALGFATIYGPTPSEVAHKLLGWLGLRRGEAECAPAAGGEPDLSAIVRRTDPETPLAFVHGLPTAALQQALKQDA